MSSQRSPNLLAGFEGTASRRRKEEMEELGRQKGRKGKVGEGMGGARQG